ncbi:MAG TPA: class I SAM-dependent methyltransferase [Candidatus Paceibacterota bacterium]
MNNSKNQRHQPIIISPEQADYALLDSGEGMKLERYGNVVLSRPDPQALWKRRLPASEWNKANASFARTKNDERGVWVYQHKDIENGWKINYDSLTFKVKPTPFKHTGLFQEQISNWQWAREVIEARIKEQGGRSADKPIRVLNLFGYTGGATISAAKAGAEVTHVDASKSSITWAKENSELSGLSERPIRWILDDAHGFVKRELRRGATYDAIIMDPPAFGRGAKGEVWRIEDDFLPFLENTLKLLSDKPLFLILNGYSAGYSPLTYENNLIEVQRKHGGTVESGELVIEEEAQSNLARRLLACGMVSRWKKY